MSVITRRVALFAATALSLATLAACGSSDEPSSGASAAAPSAEPATTTAAPATAQYADEMPKGKNPAVKDKTIGLISACESCEALPRMGNAFREAAKALGWNVRMYDTKGDVSKAQQGAETLMQAGVSAIVLESVEPGTLGSAVAQAKSKGVPIVGSLTGLTVSQSKGVLSAGVEQPLADEGEALGARMVKELGQGAKVGLFTDKLLAVGRNPEAGLRKALGAGGAKIVATHQENFAKLAADTYDTTEKWLVQYPDMKGIWCSYDGACIGAAQAVQAAGKDVTVYGINGNKGPLDLIRKGGKYVTDATPIEYGAWLATDQINALLAKREIQPDGIVHGLLVDKGNVPDQGLVDGQQLYGDFRSHFRTRWGV